MSKASEEELKRLLIKALSNTPGSHYTDNTKKPLEIEDVKKLLIGNLTSELKVPQPINFSHSKGGDYNNQSTYNKQSTKYDVTPLEKAKERYIEKQEAVKAISREKASFNNDSYGSTYVIMRFNDEVFKFLLKQLTDNKVTKHLSFSANILNEQQAIQLIKLLETNQTIQSLRLIIHNSLATTQAVAELLKKNNHLKEIQINCDNEGAEALAKALKFNSSLQSLDLCTRSVHELKK